MKPWMILYMLLPFLSSAQTFNLADTSFTTGDIFTPQVLYELGNIKLDPAGKPLLDSVAGFLMKHPALVIEVGVHTDSRTCGSEINKSRHLFQSRAEAVTNYLVSKGVDRKRLIAKGYSCRYPLVSDAVIAKLKTKEEIEAAHRKNRRTELKVTRTDFVKE